jgi:hypothetical protein
LLREHADALGSDWRDATSESDDAWNFDKLRIAKFEGRLHKRVEENPYYYGVDCGKRGAHALYEAASKWLLSEILEREIRDPRFVRETPRI